MSDWLARAKEKSVSTILCLLVKRLAEGGFGRTPAKVYWALAGVKTTIAVILAAIYGGLWLAGAHGICAPCGHWSEGLLYAAGLMAAIGLYDGAVRMAPPSQLGPALPAGPTDWRRPAGLVVALLLLVPSAAHAQIEVTPPLPITSVSGAAGRCTLFGGTSSLTSDGGCTYSGTGASFALTIGGSVTATTFIGALSGNATTATALAANPADCSAGQVATGIAASGALSCTATPTLTTVTAALTGNASTATALAADPADCSAGQVATGIAASGALTCTATPTVTTLTGNVTGAVTGNASTATALAADPADCSAGQVATGIAASGALSCTATPTLTTSLTTPLVGAAASAVAGTPGAAITFQAGAAPAANTTNATAGAAVTVRGTNATADTDTAATAAAGGAVTIQGGMGAGDAGAGGAVTLQGGIGARKFTIVDYSLIDATADTVSLTVNGGTTCVGTFIVGASTTGCPASNIQIGASNAATATNLAAWITANTASLGSITAAANGADVILAKPADATVSAIAISTSCTSGECTTTAGANGAVTVQKGSGGATGVLAGGLSVDYTTHTTVGTSEAVMSTYTIPPGTLSADGKCLRWTVGGTHAANTNNAVFKVRYGITGAGTGGTSLNSATVATSGAATYGSGLLCRTGAATEVATSNLAVPGSNPGTTTAAIDTTVATELTVTLTTATQAGDGTLYLFTVEAIN